MSEKETFLHVWEREFQKTIRVLRAFPSDRLDFKPHARSRTARDLAWTFVNEERVVRQAVSDGSSFVPFPPPPGTMPELVDEYERAHTELIGRLRELKEESLSSTRRYPVGPGRFENKRLLEIFWTMLLDMVHHRGQFSVYLRMTGGRVPSIFGPTADEPWV